MKLLIVALLPLLSSCAMLGIEPGEDGDIWQKASAGMATYTYKKTDDDCIIGISTARDVEGSVTLVIDGETCKVTVTTGALIGSEAQQKLIQQLSLMPELMEKVINLIP